MPKETLHNPVEKESIADYSGGSVEYSVVGEAGGRNPIILVPGFTEGRTVLRNFASELANTGGREVIFPDQPKISRKSEVLVIDQHAEALLAILQKEDVLNQPVDVIAHSLGSLITVRLAELAKQRGITAFESSMGSHTFFIAPAGSNSGENIAFLAGRYVKFMVNGTRYGKELDPTGEMLKAGVKNFFISPVKTEKEVAALQGKEKIYGRLGDLGLKPFIFGYAADDMYPHKVIKSVMAKNEDALAGYAVPVDSGGVEAKDFKEYKAKTGLKRGAARKSWAHHYRNAGHNDLLFHPERTVKSILQILDRQLPNHP